MSTKQNNGEGVGLLELEEMLDGAQQKREVISFNREAEVARAALRALVGAKSFGDDLIERGGRKLIIPDNMTLKEVVKYIEKLEKELQAEAQWRHVFRYRVKDGAVATHRVLRRQFGSVSTPPGWGFFGPTPPKLDEIEVGFGKREQVPVENVAIPHLPGVTFTISMLLDEEAGELFVLFASGPKKYAGEVQAIFKLIDEELAKNSIYRGQAIDGGFNFLDLSKIDPEKVVYAEDTMRQLRTNVFARIRHPERLRELGQQLKGSILLHGTFGTGKTLAAYLTALEAVEQGWTFILVRPGRDNFQEALQAAQLYAPAVVFAEDIDRLTSHDAEADRITEMLDAFDGARAKGHEVVGILTSNYADRIHKGMVRPGRIDAVIEIPPPDKPGIIRLCQTLIPDEALDPAIDDEGWSDVGDAMEGFLPAFVAEATNRAVRFMLVRSEDEGAEPLITADDIVAAAHDLAAHRALMDDAKDEPEVNMLATAFGSLVRGEARAEVREALADGFETVNEHGWEAAARRLREER